MKQEVLKRKFENVEIMFETKGIKLREDEFYDAAYKCETIADEHAIDFAEWLMEECYYQYNDKWLYRNDDEVYNTKEILKIYKYSLI